MLTVRNISEQRKVAVFEVLRQGSDPRDSFFLLVALSTAIASFGLVMNSTAVVIGAMLVAPLMTPILGLALGLVRGDPHLIGIAGRAETVGIVLSVGTGTLLGFMLPTHFEPTSEMLGRTEPNLFDLMVAVLAGTAGAFALVDEKLSPVLPGVAISTAIVPPLANCGLCIALGAYSGATGSFLLFFTNFLSILLVSGLVFYAVGMSEAISRGGVTLVRRFGIAAAGLFVITVMLSTELLSMFEQRLLIRQVYTAVHEGLKELYISELTELSVESRDDRVLVHADVKAPEIVSPSQIAAIEQLATKATGKPISLFIRTTITHDLSARGAVNQSVLHTLDGFEEADPGDKRFQLTQIAEQVVRERLEKKIGLRLEHLSVFDLIEGVLVKAEISGPLVLDESDILNIERAIKARAGDDRRVFFITQFENSLIKDGMGLMRLEFALPILGTSEELALTREVGALASNWLEVNALWLENWSMTRLDGEYHLLLEVAGGTMATEEQRLELQEYLNTRSGSEPAINLYLRTRIDTVLGPDGQSAFPALLNRFRRRNDEAYEDQIERFFKAN